MANDFVVYVSRVTGGKGTLGHYRFKTNVRGAQSSIKMINTPQPCAGSERREMINWFKARLLCVVDKTKDLSLVILFNQEFRIELYQRELLIPITREEIDMFFEASGEFRDKY